MYGDNTINQLSRAINSEKKGKVYEDLMAEAISAYCVKSGIKHRTVTGTRDDKYGGTDFQVYSQLNFLTADSGILRLDFTAGFSHKDNMPLIYIPDNPIMQLPGRPLMFGVRTSNKHAGFRDPVIVVGIDASFNDNPDDDVDIQLVQNKLQANTLKHAPAILSEAGSVLATYVRLSRPEYSDWLNSEEAERDDVMIHDDYILLPNYNGTKLFNTKRPTYETRYGIRVARDIAKDDVLNTEKSSPLYTASKRFLANTDHLENMSIQANSARRSEKMSWLMQLHEQQEKIRREAEKQDTDDINPPK